MSQTAEINAATRFCAVYGHPVKHSASPAMHNAALANLGLDWRYLAFDVRVETLREALRGAQAMRFIGLNLTVPHKLHAMELMDELDAKLLLGVLTALKKGDFSARMPSDLTGLPGKIADIIDFEVGRDVVRAQRSFHLALVSTYADLAALDRYAKHEDHLPVIARARELCAQVAAVDYEVLPGGVTGN